MDYKKIKVYLSSAGETDMTKFKLTDNSDGLGIILESWGYENIPKPTISDLEEITIEQISQLQIASQQKNILSCITNPSFLRFMFPEIEQKIAQWLETPEGKLFLSKL